MEKGPIVIVYLSRMWIVTEATEGPARIAGGGWPGQHILDLRAPPGLDSITSRSEEAVHNARQGAC